MKVRKYITLLLIMLISINVYGASDKCEKEELNRLKLLADKVEFKYDYKINSDKKAIFSITATNLNKDLRVLIIEDYYNEKYKEFKNNDNHVATLDNFNAGEKVEITLRGYVANRCSGEVLKVKTIKLPYYNYFYDEEFCKDNFDFKYCKLLLDGEITENEYNLQLKRYQRDKENKNSEIKPESVKKNDNIIMIIGISLVIVIIIIVVASLIIRRRRNNSI